MEGSTLRNSPKRSLFILEKDHVDILLHLVDMEYLTFHTDKKPAAKKYCRQLQDLHETLTVWDNVEDK
jgi:hypothetical protein